MQFSDKQARLASFGSRDARFIMVSGVTQTGKTEAAVSGFGHWATRMFAEHNFVLAAKSQVQMDGNVIAPLRDWCRRNGLEMEKAPDRHKTWRIRSALGGWNYFIEVIARDGVDQAAKRIQGYTLAGVYCDELPKFPPDLVPMLSSRMLMVPGSKFVATMNPEGPRHWVKEDYIDKITTGELSGENFYFGFPDNPIATQEAINDLAASYSGPFYQRMILGKWVAASGVIHPVLDDTYSDPPDEPVQRYEVALDFGRTSVTYGLLVAYYPSGYWVVDEWHHDGAEQGVLTAKQQAAAMHERFSDGRSIAAWVLPFDAHGIDEWLAENSAAMRVRAFQDNEKGIDWTNLVIEGGGNRTRRLHIAPGLVHLARDLDSYVWKEDPLRRGQQIPDKAAAEGAHCADALRYWAATAEAQRRGVDY